jgi:hypothetical protein
MQQLPTVASHNAPNSGTASGMRVYLLGAGFNLGLGEVEGRRRPFLINSFFQLALTDEEFRDQALSIGEAVFDFIKDYWKLDIEDLERRPFDLEECYTMLQLQEENVSHTDQEGKQRFLALRSDLTRLLGSYLDDRTGEIFPLAPKFANEVRASDAQVITFNYDTTVEDAFRVTSGRPNNLGSNFIGQWIPPPTTPPLEVPDEALALSPFSWRFTVGYGFEFDDVGIVDWSGNIQYVSRERFYGHPDNRLNEKPILKLHGSLNWAYFTYADDDSMGIALDDTIWTGRQPGGSIVSPGRRVKSYEPALITPVLHKQYRQEPFRLLWEKARNALRRCDELIVIGYSFPPTDFEVRRLLLEGFRDQAFLRLVIINPNEEAINTPKQLTHAASIEWHRGYEEWNASKLR